jgi:hypothetical protein
MLYRVRRMLDADLLRITETRQRAGRPIKIYRSTHDSGPATADVCSPETTSATFGPVIYPPR